MNKRPSVNIGTSGWHYNHWIGPFYPEDLPKRNFFQHYAKKFMTVEINNSFYMLPQTKTFESWKDQSPAGFLYAVKASRFITHMKRLKDPDRSLPEFFRRVEILETKLGPILFQLPPHWKYNEERFQQFLAALPRSHRYAFEFRDQSWINDNALALLKRYGAALVLYDFGELSVPKQATADFVYVRLHGPGGPYEGSYSLEELRTWSDAIAAWSDDGLDVFCYFDNDQCGYAPKNAIQLMELVQSARKGSRRK
ncbi:DUF72 domain-containing protein [Desulfomonile tiedjei]|uniref:DUF72 domain-containing protein n=1 Tax=Desulfomonile tiedjei (strain ATCC 49306 / DSM 6799 / DCB-1) TaxID=706587 RepID=I4C702_DESTA|nr:DUF72 domain-containing protein [Desulfomonile tiedjei]AFM25343.1 hypothetical protein Desti_2664 [Desulfomonile tiedjei DSM 6799]